MQNENDYRYYIGLVRHLLLWTDNTNIAPPPPVDRLRITEDNQPRETENNVLRETE